MEGHNPMNGQCTAKSKTTGERCKKLPMKGGTVCRNHGGAAPQVLKKARERLNDLVDPAINRLAISVDLDEHPAIALKAAGEVLDRTGYKPSLTVEAGDTLLDALRQMEADRNEGR